jgi:3-oxoacyl-[acyl-carrier protein] reductase
MTDCPEERIALVTGGSRGIGEAIVQQLAAAGWKVAFTYHGNEQAAAGVCERVGQAGGAAFAFQADARDYSRALEVVKDVENSVGPIRLLVNNAGIKKDMAFFRMTPEAWEDVIDTNLGGTFNYSRAVIFEMIKRQAGVVLNIVSVSGIIGLAGQTNYSASKAAVIGFTRALSKEVARLNIRVNAVAPGFIETDMLTSMPEATRSKIFAQIPMGSPGAPSDVASVVLFLSGEGGRYITGQVIPVDGGMI